MIEKYGIKIELPEPFLQENLENYQVELQKITDLQKITPAQYESAVVKASMACGWIDGIGEVGKQRPGVISWAAAYVVTQISEARELPPE